MKSLSFRALILKRLKYQERDALVFMLDTEGEKIQTYIPGYFRSQKRFGNTLEPGHYVQTKGNLNPKKGLQLQEALLINDFYRPQLNYDQLHLTMELLKTVDRLTYTGTQSGSEIFTLLAHALLNLKETKNTDAYKLQFKLKLYRLLGFLPHEDWMTDFLNNPLATPPQVTAHQVSRHNHWIHRFETSLSS